MVYKFRSGYSAPVPAQVIGERLAELEAADRLNPAAVVDDARPHDAPLHPAFEWNNKAAAELYRQDQARSIIRSVCVLPEEADDEEQDEPRIAFVSIGENVKGGSKYVTTSRAMGDDDMRNHVLEDAIRALHGIRSRYAQLRELADVFAAIDNLQAASV